MLSNRHTTFIIYKAPVIIWALLILIGSSIPRVEFPKLGIQFIDKIIHIAIFGIFCLLFYRALMSQKWITEIVWKKVFVACIITLAYGILNEYYQSMIPGRMFDVQDMIANGIGGILAILLLMWFIKWKAS